VLRKPNPRKNRGENLRTIALRTITRRITALRTPRVLAAAGSLLIFASFSTGLSQGQVAQIDVAVGGSTMFSQKSNSSSEAYVQPPLKGGVYPELSFDVRFKNRFGINAEGVFRYHHTFYDQYQEFRPIFYDINGTYTSRVNKKMSADFLGGVGGESLLFYNVFGSCPTETCRDNLSATHLMLHAGFDLRYYVWQKRRFFIRPEANFYRLIDNSQFSSSNILRLGASIGYSFPR
jgi:hypothetical protein